MKCLPAASISNKVCIMRSALRFLGCAVLALSLVGFAAAQDKDSSSTGSTPVASTPVASTPAPPGSTPSTMNNIDAIGNRNVGCNKGVGNWYSLEKQVAMGRSYSQQVEHGAKLISDPVVTEYVNRVGQNPVSYTHLRA